VRLSDRAGALQARISAAAHSATWCSALTALCSSVSHTNVTSGAKRCPAAAICCSSAAQKSAGAMSAGWLRGHMASK
jgi:hypothetical protein